MYINQRGVKYNNKIDEEGKFYFDCYLVFIYFLRDFEQEEKYFYIVRNDNILNFSMLMKVYLFFIFDMIEWNIKF